MKQVIYPALGLLLLCTACNSVATPVATDTAPAPAPGHFGGSLTDYWYGGEAEISTYDLRQARYGELRNGTAVLIQVSEDFLTDAQVKNDKYDNENSTPILKTNLIRRFTTGIYDYSVMTSVFTPTRTAEQPHTLKVTTSVQDWCGQSFTQLNYRGGDRWAMQLRSYFESEGDQDTELAADWLEDEVFNRIRTDGGNNLPTGQLRIIPATGYLLMTHRPYAAASAEVSLLTTDTSAHVYRLEYPDLERRVDIFFDPAPPYAIRGWEETYPSRGERLTTRATLRQRTQQPYWNQNGTQDDGLRRELGLPQ